MFFASRVFLFIFVIIAALVCVELFVFGAATAGVGLTGHGSSWTDFGMVSLSVVIGVLIIFGLKYVFRPPAIRARFWTVFLALPLIALEGSCCCAEPA
ncbi:MAG TPA: hypothetical protein VF618_02475 [Thermoanaerobaculia bacterium]